MKDENNTKLKRYFKEIENWSTLFQNNVLLLTSPSFSIFKLNIVSTPRSIFVYSEIDENNTHRKTIIAMTLFLKYTYSKWSANISYK
jgi:hypothetical protein